MRNPITRLRAMSLATVAILCGASSVSAATLDLGPQQVVQADGQALDVGTYSVPGYADWDNDGRNDLIVGQRTDGKVRLYLNNGTRSVPTFSGFSYVQADGSDLRVNASGCLGSFPRVVDWNSDSKKDLLVGDALGNVNLFLNLGTDAAPVFDGGTYLQVGPPGSKVNIDVGSRATSSVVDWNNDGKKDLVVGEITDGAINLFLNEGTDGSPDFVSQTLVQDIVSGLPLSVPGDRSSPVLMDLDGDGKKDILTGNTLGQLLLYSNAGSDAEPLFSSYTSVTSEGMPIALDTRSRPFACDWTGDGLPDVLVGDYSGRVYLYEGVPEPTTVWLLAMGGLGLLVSVLLRRRGRAR